MKPENAQELEIASDLSGASLSHAYDLLVPPYTSSTCMILKVPSQLVSLAAILVVGWSLTIEIDFSYGPYEWSLHRTIWTTDADGKVVGSHSCVWCPGA